MQPISWWSCCCVSDSGAADCWTQWVRVATVVAACSPIKPSGLPSQCYSDFDLPLSEQMMHNSAVDYRRPQPSGKPGEVRGIWQWSGKSRGKRKKLGKFCASLSMSNCSCYHPFVHRPGKAGEFLTVVWEKSWKANFTCGALPRLRWSQNKQIAWTRLLIDLQMPKISWCYQEQWFYMAKNLQNVDTCFPVSLLSCFTHEYT